MRSDALPECRDRRDALRILLAENVARAIECADEGNGLGAPAVLGRRIEVAADFPLGQREDVLVARSPRRSGPSCSRPSAARCNAARTLSSTTVHASRAFSSGKSSSRDSRV